MNTDTSGLVGQVCLRAAQGEDEAFLFQVYASTRAEEMALVPWISEQKSAFLRFQYEAQRSHYQSYQPPAHNLVIMSGDILIGRMIVSERESEILLMDIALLPEYRGQGIGTALIKRLMEQAASQHKAIVLHVETFNRALKLYERLGFVKTGEMGIYQEMNWRLERG